MEFADIIPFVIIILLVFCSGFFSGSETGLTAASRARLHKLKVGGEKRAETVEKLREDKDRLIGAILLGNNAVNILASAIATSVAIDYFGDNGVIFATITMTLLVLIFAEVLPKTYAFSHAEQVSIVVAPVMQRLVKLLAPITLSVELMVNIVLKALGVNKQERLMSSTEELRGAIELHHHDGDMVKYDKDMLASILDLAVTEVSEVMVHRKNVVSINIDQPSLQVIQQVLATNYTRVPLWRDNQDNIVGLLHVKALLKALRGHEGSAEDLDIGTIVAEPWFVPETTTLSQQLLQFREKKMHLAFVVDEYGDLAGMVTLEDVLEEIVGDIEEEHDDETDGVKQLKSGAMLVQGDMSIRDLNRMYDLSLPDDHANTIAGLVMHEARAIPDEGQVFEYHSFRFTVMKKNINQITLVKMQLVSGEADVT